jgi:hypothetical protein
MSDASSEQPQSLANRQLAAARRDPRLGHGRDAVVADWWAAMGAAERVRTLADWGLQELLESETHEEQRLKAQGIADGPARDAALQAARERAKLARAEKDNQLAELNATTLVSMLGALDALVEGLVPRARDLLVEHFSRRMIDEANKLEPEAAAQIDEKSLKVLEHAVQKIVSEQLGASNAVPKGTGAKRWESVLANARLQAPLDRSIPEDLDLALNEMVQLRHVLTHRAGRIDEKALANAPSLRYAEGELVRITRAEYRRYSAALWTYGEEIIHRLLRDLAPPPSLESWRQNHTLNA